MLGKLTRQMARATRSLRKANAMMGLTPLKQAFEMPAATAKTARRKAEASPGPMPEMARGVSGGRDYRLFKPTKPRAKRALVVLLHGCKQDAVTFAACTGFNALAEAEGLHVLYPEQERMLNPMGCWNWFQRDNHGRVGGEPEVLAEMIAEVQREARIPKRRVFVAGLSAGGAMTALLADTHPEMLTAVGIHSGLPARSAGSVSDAFAVMGQGARGDSPNLKVPLIVFQGEADSTVNPENGEVFGRALGEGPTTAGSAGGRKFTRKVTPKGEYWRVAGLGHAWSGGPGTTDYSDPKGPDASAEMLRFFLEKLDG